jgi:hypothetical protein
VWLGVKVYLIVALSVPLVGMAVVSGRRTNHRDALSD